MSVLQYACIIVYAFGCARFAVHCWAWRSRRFDWWLEGKQRAHAYQRSRGRR